MTQNVFLPAGIDAWFNVDVPTLPRFMGQSTWISLMGSKPNHLAILVVQSSTIISAARSGSSVGMT